MVELLAVAVIAGGLLALAYGLAAGRGWPAAGGAFAGVFSALGLAMYDGDPAELAPRALLGRHDDELSGALFAAMVAAVAAAALASAVGAVRNRCRA